MLERAFPNEQLDCRWSARYRAIVGYDPYHWWTPAFSPAEEEEPRTCQFETMCSICFLLRNMIGCYKI